MANIQYLQMMINQFLGSEKRVFLFEKIMPDTNMAAIDELESSWAPTDIFIGQDAKSTISLCGQTHEKSSLSA